MTVEQDINRKLFEVLDLVKDGKLIANVPVEKGDGANTIVQKESNGVAFGENSVLFGTSSTNAKDRGITEESTDEEIVTEWSNSDPESDKFALVKGEGALVEGNNNLALGKNSHAEGNATLAAGNASHAEGVKTFTQNIGEHAEGTYNKSNTGDADAEKTIHSVGIGTADNARSNAVEVMKNGDAYLLGVGGYDGTNPAAATPINQLIGQGGSSSAIVVEGTWSMGGFEPSVGSPSWSDVKDAFLSGSMVLLKSVLISCTVVGYYDDPDGEGQFLYGINPLLMSSDAPLRWGNPDL